MEEKMVDAVFFVCPNCEFEGYESVEELRKQYGFDGKDLKSLPKFDCDCCMTHKAKAQRIEKIPASWLEPF